MRKYFTLSKAERLWRLDFKELNNEELQKKIILLLDYNRYLNDRNNYRDILIDGGFFIQVCDSSASGLAPKNMWLQANLKSALDEALKEKESRTQLIVQER